ncbi:MAG: cyclic nucleotide-binding domain-containing protein [Thermoanaerobaculia bacterium]
MALKNPFGRKQQKFDTASLSVDDLMVLERWDEAEKILHRRITRNAHDLRARLKLADLFTRSGRQYEAVDEYLGVADGYARDGFYDKAVALLSKVEKLVPGYEKTRVKMEKMERAKRLERSRQTAMEAVLAKRGEDFQKAGTTAFEVQQLWQNLSGSLVIQRLDGDQLARLFSALEIVHYQGRTLIAERTQELEELYLVAKGKVDVSIVMPDGQTMVLREFQPGDVFGERALLEHLPWPATYESGHKTIVMRLTREGLEQAMAGNPNPRELLDALRDQRLDANIVSLVQRTEM